VANTQNRKNSASSKIGFAFCEIRTKRSVEVYKGEDLDAIPSQTVADILARIRHPIPV